jgi:hypothetical protein
VLVRIAAALKRNLPWKKLAPAVTAGIVTVTFALETEEAPVSES